MKSIVEFPFWKVSVFAVVSFVVYLYTSLDAVPQLSKGIVWTVEIDGESQRIDIPYFWIPTAAFHFVIALRLYAHAWAVEASPHLRTTGSVRRFFEWWLRFGWVILVTYLPTFLAGLTEVDAVGGPIEWYYSVTFLALVVWDFLMVGKIKGALSKFAYVRRGGDPDNAKRTIIRRWVLFDVLLFAVFLSLCTFQFTWSGDWHNWKPMIFVLALTISGGICITQLLIWVPEIKVSLEMSAANAGNT